MDKQILNLSKPLPKLKERAWLQRVNKGSISHISRTPF